MLLSAFLQPVPLFTDGAAAPRPNDGSAAHTLCVADQSCIFLYLFFLIIRFQCRLTVSCHILWCHGACNQLLCIRIEDAGANLCRKYTVEN